MVVGLRQWPVQPPSTHGGPQVEWLGDITLQYRNSRRRSPTTPMSCLLPCRVLAAGKAGRHQEAAQRCLVLRWEWVAK